MGLGKVLSGCRVYFDTNILIYLLQNTAAFQRQILDIQAGLQTQSFQAFASDLTLTELLPPLVKNNNQTGIQQIIALLNDPEIFTKTPSSQDVFIQAGFLRGHFNMKTPDALHIAYALEGRCQLFLTNDKGIKCPKGMQRVLLSAY